MSTHSGKTGGRGGIARLVAVVLVFLVIGAAVNVLVAWGTVAASQNRWLVLISYGLEPGGAWPFPTPEYASGDPPEIWHDGTWWKDVLNAVWKPGPEIVGLHGQGRPFLGENSVVAVGQTFGVPFRCVGTYRLPATEQRSRGTVAVSIPGVFRANMPAHVLWPGFALNTLIYAGLAWGLWRLPFAGRRWRRKRRNQCLACGYSRAGLAGGSACPECGSPRF